jgi:hypothetical protein
LGTTLTAVVTALAATAYVHAAQANGPMAGYVEATVSASPTFPPPATPTPDPTGTPTPDPTEPPIGICPVEPTPLPTDLPTVFPTDFPAALGVAGGFGVAGGVGVAAHAPVALADPGPFTCDDGEQIVTVSVDGKNVKIVIDAVQPTDTKCTIDPKSVTVVAPNNGKVNANGSVEIPYDKTKTDKITIKIEYEITCVDKGGVKTVKKQVATIEFTPPEGPVDIEAGPRPAR